MSGGSGRVGRAGATAVVLAAGLVVAGPRPAAAQDYEILAARYGTVPGFPLRGLLPDAPEGETLDIAMAVWVVRNDERVVLFDTGFFRPVWFDRFEVRDYERPDSLLMRVGIRPEDVTDVVVSHAHWDHMGGLELFPEAMVWIQDAEYGYYTAAAWQPGGNAGGIDPDDIAHLVARNLAGSVRLIPGDDVEILPGITVYTGARHTYASQYVRVGGAAPFVLASDNAYLDRNVAEERAGATFSAVDRAGNVAAVRRMVELAGDAARVVPGHDPEVFERYPEVVPGVVRVRPGG
ncbi:MAG: N-acyl homoserine lactonase family protein [Longimicrobiales bacterium]